MNITESIARQIGVEVAVFLSKTPEIQVYFNSSMNKYQWRDGRFIETASVWDNISYSTRQEMVTALKKLGSS